MSGQEFMFHTIFHGRVQGVSFRAMVRAAATNIGLIGTVQNLPDGTVEVYAQGTKIQYDKLISELKMNPGASRIDRVDETVEEITKHFDNFEVLF